MQEPWNNLNTFLPKRDLYLIYRFFSLDTPDICILIYQTSWYYFPLKTSSIKKSCLNNHTRLLRKLISSPAMPFFNQVPIFIASFLHIFMSLLRLRLRLRTLAKLKCCYNFFSSYKYSETKNWPGWFDMEETLQQKLIAISWLSDRILNGYL